MKGEELCSQYKSILRGAMFAPDLAGQETSASIIRNFRKPVVSAFGIPRIMVKLQSDSVGQFVLNGESGWLCRSSHDRVRRSATRLGDVDDMAGEWHAGWTSGIRCLGHRKPRATSRPIV